MIQKLPLSDFRAVRHKLEPHEFAISEGQDIAPTHLIDEETMNEPARAGTRCARSGASGDGSAKQLIDRR
jgi:hypothetical protein